MGPTFCNIAFSSRIIILKACEIWCKASIKTICISCFCIKTHRLTSMINQRSQLRVYNWRNNNQSLKLRLLGYHHQFRSIVKSSTMFCNWLAFIWLNWRLISLYYLFLIVSEGHKLTIYRHRLNFFIMAHNLPVLDAANVA